MTFQPGDIAWIEGKTPARVERIDPERRLVEVIYPARERRWDGGWVRIWKPLKVAECMLEREPRKAGV